MKGTRQFLTGSMKFTTSCEKMNVNALWHRAMGQVLFEGRSCSVGPGL